MLRNELVSSNDLAEYGTVVRALREVRDAGLYKETHNDFEAYCRDRWGLTSDLIAQVNEDISGVGLN